jgi:NAD(P)-dependent dehydrogenase (short-subunit alcohol dehydrogenase family)
VAVTLVTGASRGIGKATAVALAAAGFDVAITARTLKEGQGIDDSDDRVRPVAGGLETTAALVEEAGRRALPVAANLLDHASLTAAVDAVLDQWGGIDVLVNNAVHTGPGSMERLGQLSIAMLETKLAANAVAPVVLIQRVLPGMLARGSGTIIDMTSHVATHDPPVPAGEGGWGLAYAMSKGAIHRIAGIVAVETGGSGIKAYNVDPGFVLTERMLENQGERGLERRYRGAPPTVPAAVVAWLATEANGAAASLNGQTVRAQKLALELGLHPDWR